MHAYQEVRKRARAHTHNKAAALCVLWAPCVLRVGGLFCLECIATQDKNKESARSKSKCRPLIQKETVLVTPKLCKAKRYDSTKLLMNVSPTVGLLKTKQALQNIKITYSDVLITRQVRDATA